MDVEYRPVGKNHRVVAVLELIDGKPAREISIRRYIRWLKQERRGPAGERLKPLKNVLREYLKANPEYAIHLRLKDSSQRGQVQITDGKFVLKQLPFDELRERMERNELFIDVVAYRQIARQTDNFRVTGNTQRPLGGQTEKPPAPARDHSWVRRVLNVRPALTTAVAVVLLAGSLTWAVARGRTAPQFDYSGANNASAYTEQQLTRGETAVRIFRALLKDDPEAARLVVRDMKRFVAGVNRERLSASQAERLDRIRGMLPAMEEACAEDTK